MISDLDIVFRANPFVALDQLTEFDVVSWMESTPIQANGGLNFVRGWNGGDGGNGGDGDGNGGGGAGDGGDGGDGGRVGFRRPRHKVAEWMLAEFDRRQRQLLDDPSVGYTAENIGYFHPGLRPAEVQTLVNKFYGDAGMVQGCTDDQDMWQDVIDSAVNDAIITRKQFRAFRKVLENAMGNGAEGEEKVQNDAHSGYNGFEHPLNFSYPTGYRVLNQMPELHRYARENFHCSADVSTAQLTWVNMSHGEVYHRPRGDYHYLSPQISSLPFVSYVPLLFEQSLAFVCERDDGVTGGCDDAL